MDGSESPALSPSAAVEKRASTTRYDAGPAPSRRLGVVRGLLPWLSRTPSNRPTAPGHAPLLAPQEAALATAEPFVAGTGILGGLVPPIASDPVRRLAGHDSVPGYFLASDTWLQLVGRFLKARSKVLELGCGCGDLARGLMYQPHLSRYVGLDSQPATIEWCRASIEARAPERFQFILTDAAIHGDETADGPDRRTTPLTVPDLAFDLIVARSLPHERDESAMRSLLSQVVGALCLNGLFLAAVPTRMSALPVDGAFNPGDSLEPDRFQQLAEEAGLQVYQRMGLLGVMELFILTPAPSISPQNQEDGVQRPRQGAFLTEEMLRLNRIAAAEHEVESAVHPDDFIYRFCATHPLLSLDGGIQYYFRDGGNSAQKLINLITRFDDLDLNSIKLLEFASGYGCVTRHLKKWPQVELVSCDIHPQALEFLTRTIGVRSQPSSHHPEGFQPPEKFDVIFALSFFSHMPRSTWGRWLRALYGALHDPGYLVFTTLGLKACSDFGIEASDIPEDGLWFEARSEQHDLNEAEYGMTVVTPDFVRNEVERQLGTPIFLFKQVGWWDNQDLWVVKRES